MSNHPGNGQFRGLRSNEGRLDVYAERESPPRCLEDGELSIKSTQMYQNSRISDHAFAVQGDVISSSIHIHPAKGGAFQKEDVTRGIEEACSQKYETLVQSLQFSRMGVRLLNIDEALLDTCQWFLHHHKFAEWTNNDSTSNHRGFLWIKGNPGSGKSTIMKLVFETAKRQWRDEIVISYFFNGRAPSHLERSSLGLYRSLLHQLIRLFPAAKEPFLDRFAVKEFNGRVDEWTVSELKGFLFELLTRFEHPPLNIFIDALDEGKDDDVRQMVSFVERLSVGALASSSKLRICFSSRYYPHITVRNGLQIELEQEHRHMQDIQIYVRELLHYDLSKLIHEVCEKSAGIFFGLSLWSQC